MSDEYYMQRALEQAELAKQQGEVPVGAVLVLNDKIIARAYNQPISLCDPTAHAEMLVMRDSAKNIGNYRLIDTTMYVTLQPCPMCLNAMVHARVARCVIGASDPRWGKVNHTFETTEDVLAQPCGDILKQFFKERR